MKHNQNLVLNNKNITVLEKQLWLVTTVQTEAVAGGTHFSSRQSFAVVSA